MSISAGKVPKVRSVTIIRGLPLIGGPAAAQDAARLARFTAAIGLLIVRSDVASDVMFTDVSTAQTHTYEFAATANPIQDGSTVTDHVRRMPEALDVEGLITDTPIGILSTPIFAGRAVNNFNRLLAFAQERQPVLVATSLRIYENMIITRVVATRGVDSGSSIPVSISFREIRVAQALVELPGVAAAAAAVGFLPPVQTGQQSPLSTTP